MADPITAAAIEVDPEYVYTEDGQEFDYYDVTFPPDAIEQIRIGRACMRCWERQDISYFLAPGNVARKTREKHLPGCVYSPDGIQNRQQKDFADEFDGAKWIGPKQKLEDAIAEDDERRLKYRIDTGRKAGPTVPRWVEL